MKRQSVVAYGESLNETAAEIPSVSGTEVLVRVRHCGVCHSDVHIQDGYFDLGGDKQLDISGGRSLPFTLGHEIEGVLEAAGDDAKAALDGRNIGSRYVVFPWIGCGTCGACLRGEEQLCREGRQLGVDVDGGYAEYVVVPHPKYLLDYTGLPADLAGCYMCSGLTAYGALKKLGAVEPGGTIAIVGVGGVGLMGLQFAKAMFPEARIFAADVDPAKLEAARQAGADEVIDCSDAQALRTVLKATGGVAGAIDFAGTEGSLTFATGVLAKGGKAVVVGLMGGGFAMPIPMFPIKAISIIGSYTGSLRDAEEMLVLVKQGAIAPIPVETRALDQANAALDDLRAGSVVGRVVLAI